MHAATERDVEVRLALDRHVRDALRMASWGIGGLFLLFTLVDMVVWPGVDGVRVALVDGAVGVAFLLAAVALRTRHIPASSANILGATLASLVVASLLHDAWLLGDVDQAMFLLLVVVGAGSLLLSRPWVIGVVAGSLVSWLVVTLLVGDAQWVTASLAVFAAGILALVLHEVRLRAYTGIERMRAQNARRKSDLEIRERALRAAVDALARSEDRYRRLVEDAPDAFLVQSGGRVAYVNQACVDMFGVANPEALLDVDPLTLFREEDRETARRLIAGAGEGQSATAAQEVRAVRGDGSIIDVEVIGRPIDYGGHPAVQTIIRDITDRKRVEREHSVARDRLHEIERLREMDRIKTQFVNTISHELRTPLTPIRVQLHLLQRAGLREDQMRKATDVLSRNFARLDELVDELLEVARIQAGTLRLTQTRIDVSEVVGSAIESYVDVASQHGVALTARVDADLEVVADGKRVGQVLYNLLGNAMKFTPDGGSVRVEALRGDGEIIVRVIDNGRGLAPDQIDRLFEPFSQVHDPMEQTQPGTGLGLYICRGIVEGHGGRIWAQSDGLGHGATFSFTLPLERPGAPADAAAQRAASELTPE